MSRCLSVVVLLLGLSAHLVHAKSYQVTGSIPIGGTGHWDYLVADADNRRLYVSGNVEVVVIDLDSQKILGKIPVGGFSHGIAVAPDVNLGFITTGGSGTDARKCPRNIQSADLKATVEFVSQCFVREHLHRSGESLMRPSDQLFRMHPTSHVCDSQRT
jgi:hypothetical protein